MEKLREKRRKVSKEIRSRISEKFFQEFLDYISIDESEFLKTIDKFRPDHLWTKEKNSEIKAYCSQLMYMINKESINISYLNLAAQSPSLELNLSI